jgi:hypothetical protein
MGIEVTWDNDEKTIIHYYYGKNWSWEDFRQAGEISNAMAVEVHHTVDIIADFLDGSPPPIGALGRFKNAQESMPENIKSITVVGGGTFINALVGMFSRLYRPLGEQLLIAKSLNEARDKINQKRGYSP